MVQVDRMMSETNTLAAIATSYQPLPNGGLTKHNDLKDKQLNHTAFGLSQNPLQNGAILKARKENSSTKIAANVIKMEELSEQDVDCETPCNDYGVQSQPDEIVSWDGSDVSDIENFEGEIVYRPDGSAFLIDNSELLDNDNFLDNESDGKNANHTSSPQIVNALHIPAYMTAKRFAQFEADLTKQYSNPVVHSFRVYDMRQNCSENGDSKKDNCDLNHQDETLEGHGKPILMCFLCKLSFGNSKSFLMHATSEHILELNELERKVMSRKSQSAIIQGHGKDKSALLSFLELKSTENPAPWINSSKPHSESNFFPSLFPIQTMNYDYPTTSNMSKVIKPCNDRQEENDRNSTENISDEHYEDNDASPGADSNTPVCNSTESEIKCASSKGNSSDRTRAEQCALKAEQESEKVCDFKVPTSNANDINSADGASDETKDGALTRRESTPKDNRPDSCEGTSNFVFTESPMSVTSNPDSDGHLCTSEGEHQMSSSVECPKCDMVLGSSRSLGGHMTMMHSRNSCKTLKCPKCNWHYKYQQTLEAHMKEKHPESETKCVYCETNQSHPRLSRGETYTCGYKPYRCDICNYSTTTKGNLSIHNQSDKHLNNLKELQNGGDHLYLQTNIDVPGGAKPKPKQTWRCDVCDYETNVARNLRIHMTSEKHMHNMLAIQQNVSQMQREMTKFGPFQSEESVYAAYMTQQLMPMISPDGTAVDMQNLMAQYASAAYDPAAYAALVNGMQMMPPQQQPQQEEFMDESPAEDDDPSKNQPLNKYHCSVCNKFGTDDLKELQVHLQRDRNQPCEDLWRLVIGGDLQQCILCNYSTHLKANFQLHTKTDKHMQKLQLFNHIREGGKQNEWRLKYLNVGNPTQVRCNACDFYTYSVEKLSAHSQPGNYRHESNMKLFRRLQQMNITVNSVSKRFHCTLCNYSTKGKMNLMQHVQSLQHLRKEQDDDSPSPAIAPPSPSSAEGALDLSKKDKPSPTGIDAKDSADESQTTSQLAELEDQNSNNNQIYNCRYCKYSSTDQQRITAHVLSQHSIKPPALLRCSLCQEICTNKINLEVHLMESHSVSRECIQRLISALDFGSQSGSATPVSQPQTLPETAATESIERPPSNSRDSPCYEDSGDTYRCQKCHLKFANIDLLYDHQNDTCPLTEQETPGGPGFLCWKKGCNQYFKSASVLQMHFKEIHAKKHQLQQNYKFYCSQCNQSFPTEERLELHAQQHLLKEATICSICQQNFHTLGALRRHLENDHLELSKGDLLKFVNAISDTEKFSNSLEEAPEPEVDENAPESPKMEGSSSIDSIFASWNEAAEKPTDESYTDPVKKFKCHRCHYGFRLQSELSSHNKTLLHRRGDRIPYTLPVVDKFNNPNRPFKCDVCRESFTQKSILLVHLNSVSHLHKLNKTLCTDVVDMEQMPELQQDKPYKCEVCKVAYSQSTTLDIHMRSVLHKRNTTKAENRASINNNEQTIQAQNLELQSKPPNQQSNAEKAMEKMQKRLEAEQEKVREAEEKADLMYHQDMQHTLHQLHHQSTKDDLRGASMAHFADAQAQAMANMAAAMMLHNPLLPQQNLYGCDKCTSVFVSQEALQKHQETSCYATAEEEEEPEPLSPSQLSQKMMDPTLMLRRRRSAIQRRLLEGYGYDLVQQFNECAQGLPSSIAEKDKFSCLDCKKEFSSIWVYKAHVEEVHKSLLPSDDVEMYSNDYRQEEYALALAAENESKPKAEQITVKIEKDTDKPNGTGQPLPGITPQQLNLKDQALQKQASQSQQEQSQHLQAQMTAQALSAQALASQQMFMANSFPFGMVPPMQAMLPGVQAVYPVPSMPHMQPLQYLDPNYMQKSPKRARTRISDDQLKILRAYFDINNSPSEDQIQEMSQKSCLPHKVIKHWFRNTLFKERQRNKDSPYNFNNPPTTSLLDPPESPILKQEMKPLALTTELNLLPSSSYMPISMKRPTSESMSFAPPPHTPSSRSTIHSTTSESMSPATSPTLMSPILTSPTFTSPLTSPCAASTSTPQSPSASSGSRRAGRTRFTDYQVKILQDFFESNAYPKDDDLEHLSRMLNLSPRVIVVWFQNARQKARKVFENQPAPEGEGDGDGVRYKRTPGLNYQCNKCFLVFQRFYELIRHQKSQCFKEDSGMESASENSPSGQDLSTHKTSNKRHASSSSVASDILTPKEKLPKLNSELRESREGREPRDSSRDAKECNRDTRDSSRDARDGSRDGRDSSRDTRDSSLDARDGSRDARDSSRDARDGIKTEDKSSRSSSSGPVVHYQCEKCSMVFPHFEQWQEHQQVHMMGMNLFGGYMQSQLPYNMMYMPYEQGMTPEQYFNYVTGKELAAKSPSKRKHSEASDEASGSTSSEPSTELNSSSADQPRDKRLRTTISAAQLDILYSKFQEDSNPTRRMLDMISKEVGLKKRVVQVWFQNTRARERKGQFRMSAPNNIHRRCPFCKALFKLKSALEGHIKIHHSDQQLTPGAIDSILAQSPSQISPSGMNDGEQAMNLSMHKSTSRYDDVSDDGSKYDIKDKGESVSLSSKYEGLVLKTNGSFEGDEDIEYTMDDDDLATVATKDSDLMSPGGSMLGDEIIETTPSEAGSVERSEDSISFADETDSQKSKDFSKRYRTQISPSQLKVLKYCYGDYRTPTMHECELLGREIGLPKRVVQVWFQNARAKEKKIKTNFTKQIGLMGSGENEGSCKLCNVKYSLNVSVRDHIFTELHIRNIRRKISKEAPETEAYAGEGSLTDHASQSMLANHQAALMHQSMMSPMAAAQMQAMQQAMSAQMMSPQIQQQMLLAAQNEAVSKIKKESGADEKDESRSPKPSTAGEAAAVAAQMNMAVARNDAALVQYLYGSFAPYYAQMPFMYPAMYAMGGNEAFYPYDPSTMQGAIPPQLLQSYGGLAAAQGGQSSSPKPEKTASKPSSSASTSSATLPSTKSEKFSKDKEGLILRPKSSTNRYLCKKCERVFTDRDSVTSHQVTACYMGQVVNVEQTVEKLPSNRFLCQACPREALITEDDALKHLESSVHKKHVEHYVKTKIATTVKVKSE
ncbi:zinc finger homeobox protein 3-like [Antedon mediterranea]|uniref:zinc finger homeobox protein 3-like n=1 Tax=Antedon mediterranea TaxID=105859 RepID=UPI003AF8D718